MIRRLFLLCLLFFPLSGFSQADVGVKFISLTAHPFAENDLSLHQNPIDNKGYLTFEPGLNADIYFPLANRLRYGLDFQAAGDRFDGFTASVGVNISWMPVKYWKHRVFIGIGPKVYFWQNRIYPENHEADEGYKTDVSPARKIIPITGYAEYVYDINKQTRLCIGLTQCHPKSVGLTAGIRFIIPAFNGKGCDCPSYQ